MNKKNIIRGCSALLIISVFIVTGLPDLLPAAAFQEKRDFGELEKVILDELKENGTPGASFAIVSGDRVIYAKGFGVANVETSAPVTPD
ncbi:MAG TPA: serine hydrolase, partial [Blastocatellia bacterium]|nr:serine hydrolase [Blastocatellia bacterium]